MKRTVVIGSVAATALVVAVAAATAGVGARVVGAGLRSGSTPAFEPPPPTTSTDCSVDPSIFPLAALKNGNFVVK